MDIILTFIGLVVIILSAYMLGHWFGYGKGEADTVERMEDTMQRLHRGK